MSVETSGSATRPFYRPAALTWLVWVMRINAILYLSFFAFAMVGTLFEVLGLLSAGAVGPWVICRVRWGQGGQAYEMMISALYLVWGVFLLIASRAPLRNRSFLDFTIAANVAHFGTMFLEAVLMPNETSHLTGDVLIFPAVLVLLIAAWAPLRRYAA